MMFNMFLAGLTV